MSNAFHHFSAVFLVMLGLLAALPALSQQRQNAGVGRLFSNDFFGDRPYAGVLSYGPHGDSRIGDVQNRVGAGIVALGPQTGVGQRHGWGHDGLNTPAPDLAAQIPNAISPSLSEEVVLTVQFGGFDVRPFAEAQYSVETFARFGADIARVWSSEALPIFDGDVVELIRFQGRAGAQLSVSQADVFYGLSWMSPEFDGQPEGQLVGSLNANLRF
jgi:hypothetical protein